MNEINNGDNLEESEIDAVTTEDVFSSYKSKAYAKLSRELSENDLSNPSVSRMLLDRIDSLENQNTQLKKYEIDFHKVDKEKSVLEEKQKRSVYSEILSQFCLTLAGGLLTLSTLDFANPIKINNIVFLIFGIIMIVGSLFASWRKK